MRYILLVLLLSGCQSDKNTATIQDPCAGKGRWQLIDGVGYTLTPSGHDISRKTVFRIDTCSGTTDYYMDGEWFPVKN